MLKHNRHSFWLNSGRRYTLSSMLMRASYVAKYPSQVYMSYDHFDFQENVGPKWFLTNWTGSYFLLLHLKWEFKQSAKSILEHPFKTSYPIVKMKTVLVFCLFCFSVYYWEDVVTKSVANIMKDTILAVTQVKQTQDSIDFQICV